MLPHANAALHERIYTVVCAIPRGMVATYGDVAVIVGGIDAREVGYALGEIPKARVEEIPWQRVVARDGVISTRGLAQRQALESEGVAFDPTERVIMARHQWDGPQAAWAEANGFHTLPTRGERGEQLSLF